MRSWRSIRAMRRRLEVGWAVAVAVAEVMLGAAGAVELTCIGPPEELDLVVDDEMVVDEFACLVGLGLS